MTATPHPVPNLFGGFKPTFDEPKNLIVKRAPVTDSPRRQLLVESFGKSESELNNFTTLILSSFTHGDSLTHGVIARQYQHGIDNLSTGSYTITVSLRAHVGAAGATDWVKPSPPTPANSQRDFPIPFSALIQAKGRRHYMLVIEDGILVKIEAVANDRVDHPEPLDDGYVTITEAAKILRHAQGWLSRKHDDKPMWEYLGLIPRRSGKMLLFKKTDVYAHLERQTTRRRGRPRQETANVSG